MQARSLLYSSRPAILDGVEVSARSAGSGTVGLSPLARVARLVQPHLEEVEARIAQQVAAFDPALEGYVVYAVGSRGKRLRPLLALLAGGATGQINSNHVDLAVIVELIHAATLVHDDVMDEAERRRAQPTVNARWRNSVSGLRGDCLDLVGTESATGKTLGTDLRKGKFTLPVLIFLGSASEFEREHCCRLDVDEQIEEMIELLKNGATKGALNESIAAGSDLIREAQGTLDGIASNPCADALFSLADALCDMFDQLRV